MDYQQDPNILRIHVYWNPPPTHIYVAGDRDSMDRALQVLREEVEASIEQDPELSELIDSQLTIEQGSIGPQAQAIDTIDIVLRNLTPDCLQQIQDMVDNLRHGNVESPFEGIRRLFTLKDDYFGTELNATVVLEHELYTPFQPSIQQDLLAPILTISAPFPDHIEPGSDLWNLWIDAANSISDDFQSGVVDYLAAVYGIELDPSAIPVETVVQPPMAGPLIESYFFDISGLIAILAPVVGQAMAETVVGRVVDAGLVRIKERWPGDFPEDKDINVAANKNELLRRVKLHMASEGYSGLANNCFSVSPFNRRMEAGYPTPIDQSVPMGWIIRVEHQDGTWEFKILNDPRRVERITKSSTGGLIGSTYVNLMQDYGELYDPNVPQ